MIPDYRSEPTAIEAKANCAGCRVRAECLKRGASAVAFAGCRPLSLRRQASGQCTTRAVVADVCVAQVTGDFVR